MSTIKDFVKEFVKQRYSVKHFSKLKFEKIDSKSILSIYHDQKCTLVIFIQKTKF